MDNTISRIADDLLHAGLKPGGIVLVHSSLKSLGPVPGGPETVIQGLLQALGPKGTLLMPALSYKHVRIENPVFDQNQTPSNVGAITEYFRTRQGTSRSLHPTHSVCGVGPRTVELLSSHHYDKTPCGPHSPYRLLKEQGGQILMLGCGLEPNTSMHGVEELVEPPYLFREEVTYQCHTSEGRDVEICNRRHDFEGYAQRYDRLGEVLEGWELQTGQVLQASTYIIQTIPMWQKAEFLLNLDPFCFVEKM